MASSPIPDPFQMWRDAVSTLERNVNSAVTGGMESREAMSAVHQFSALSLGFQQAFEKAIGSYLGKVNLPSRKDVTELATTLQRVEDKLDRLLQGNVAETGSAAVLARPRPARTRRPPEADAGAAGDATGKPVKPAAPAPRAAGRTRKRA